jgi:hypothetical protein
MNEQRLTKHLELRRGMLERGGSDLVQLHVEDLQSFCDEGILQIPLLPPLLPEDMPLSFLLVDLLEGRIEFAEGRGQSSTLIRGQI